MLSPETKTSEMTAGVRSLERFRFNAEDSHKGRLFNTLQTSNPEPVDNAPRGCLQLALANIEC